MYLKWRWRAVELHDRETSQDWKKELVAAVSAHRVSDLPVGTLLLGELDRSVVTAELARRSEARVHTFTVPPREGVDKWPFADTVWSAVARRGFRSPARVEVE